MLKGHGRYGVGKENGQPVRRGLDNERSAVIASENLTPFVEKRMKETANSATGAPGGMSSRSMAMNYGLPSMEGIVAKDRKMTMQICRDIQEFDPVCGAAVELMSNLPFSGFSLTGISDRKIMEKFVKSVENARLPTIFPYLSRDFLTDGAFCGTFEFDKDRGVYNNLISHNGLDLDVQDIPIYGMDPLVTLNIPPAIKAIMDGKGIVKNDPRVAKVRQALPEIFKTAGNSGKVMLNPVSTLYIARKSLTHDTIGQSYLHRIIPLWLMEKALLRGSIEQAYQRQRAIIHIVAGTDEWEPTTDELQQMVGLVVNANMDPTGAVIATRPDINFNEVIRGDDFYKHSDAYSYLAEAKLRGLGISDSFLSGDATFTTMEVALSVFMEGIRQYRDLVTREIFNEKMFPSIALANGFKKSKRDMMATGSDDLESHFLNSGRIFQTSSGRMMAICDGSNINALQEIEDITEYYIPRVEWHKQLSPQADREYLDLLGSMREMGIPVPIRMMAAAAGLNLDQIISMMDDDMTTRETLADHLKEVNKLLAQSSGEDMGGGGEFAGVGIRSARARRAERDRQREQREAVLGYFDSLEKNAKKQVKVKRTEALAGVEGFEVSERTKGGGRRYARDSYQKKLEEAQDKKLAQALGRIVRGELPPSVTRKARKLAKNPALVY